MELIRHDYNFDFIGKRRLFVVGSIVINLAILVAAGIFGLNWGVDFAGGSEIEVKFAGQAKDVDVRKAVEEAGFGEATVQVFGPPEDNTFLVRVGRVSLLKHEDVNKIGDALQAKFGNKFKGPIGFSEEQGDKLDVSFSEAVPEAELRSALEGAGVKIHELRPGVPAGLQYQVITSGIADKVKAALDTHAGKDLPASELRRVEFVGPQVGKQLRNRGILSVVYAALAILIYIAFRFDTQFAPGAVVAMIHDIIVVFGYYVVTRREFNLTSVAVLLTIVGYSVNDTIVIYDRIRETMGKIKGKDLPSIINISLNETLARTLLTSFATALSLIGLLVFGVGQIWDFAAAMMVGIVTGTYSSIYIASPMTLWLEDIAGKKGAATSPATHRA